MPTNMTLQCCREARRAGAYFRFYVEYVGWTDKGNRSSKFWSAEGTGYGSVKISWGKIGGTPQSTHKSWSYVEEKAPEKLGKGYRYMRGVQERFAPEPKPAPLSGPFALVKKLRALSNGGFEALDAAGSVLFEMPAAGGHSLAQTYNIPVVS